MKPMKRKFSSMNSSRAVIKQEPKPWEAPSSEMQEIDKDMKSYFKIVSQRFQEDFEDDEDKALFMENVAAQTLGKEVELSCDESTSDCMQMLLINTRDPSVLERFMASFLDHLQLVCTHHAGAYVMQTLLEAALRFLQHPSDYGTTAEEDDNVEESEWEQQKQSGVYRPRGSSHMAELPSHHDRIVFWVIEVAQFFLKHLGKFVVDQVTSHVVRSVIQVLGGCYVERHLTRHRTTKKKKRTAIEVPKETVQAVDVPQAFDELFRTFFEIIETQVDLIEIMKTNVTSLLLQTLLMMSELKGEEIRSRIVKCVAKAVFPPVKEKGGLPEVCVDRIASFTVEEMLKRCPAKYFTKLWKKRLSGTLLQMSLHPVSTFCAQRVIERATSAELFQEMYEELELGFDELFDCGQVSILVCIAAACKAHSVNQDRFVKALMKTLHCADPEDRRVFLAPLILYMTRYEDYEQAEPATSEVYQGSLLLQHLLSFGKTKKVAQSLLAMGAEHLKAVACCRCGSHVLDAFVRSDHVKKANKEKLVTLLKGHFESLALDKYGSCFVMNLWDSTDMAQKVAIAEELSPREGTLTSSVPGRLVSKKLNLYHFIHRRNDWNELQKSQKKASALFKDIIE